jgi:hypothetical protein
LQSTAAYRVSESRPGSFSILVACLWCNSKPTGDVSRGGGIRAIAYISPCEIYHTLHMFIYFGQRKRGKKGAPKTINNNLPDLFSAQIINEK